MAGKLGRFLRTWEKGCRAAGSRLLPLLLASVTLAATCRPAAADGERGGKADEGRYALRETQTPNLGEFVGGCPGSELILFVLILSPVILPFAIVYFTADLLIQIVTAPFRPPPPRPNPPPDAPVPVSDRDVAFAARGRFYTAAARLREVDAATGRARGLRSGAGVYSFDVDDGGLWWVEKESRVLYRLRHAGRPDRVWDTRADSAILWTARYAVAWAEGAGVRFVPKEGGEPSDRPLERGIRFLAVDYARDRVWARRGGEILSLGPGEPSWTPARIEAEDSTGQPEAEALQTLAFGRTRFAFTCGGEVWYGRPEPGVLRVDRGMDFSIPVKGIAFNARDEDVVLAWDAVELWVWDLVRHAGRRTQHVPAPAYFDRRGGQVRRLDGSRVLSHPCPPDEDPRPNPQVIRAFERLEACIEKEDWESLPSLIGSARRLHDLAPDGSGGWTGLARAIEARLSTLPRSAFERYRLAHDGAARAAFERAGELHELERAIDEYFFASDADIAIDFLAGRCLDRGEAGAAVHLWERLLYRYPDPDLPREVIAARIAHAARSAGDAAALELLVRHVRERGIAGTVVVGGRTVDLREFLGLR